MKTSMQIDQLETKVHKELFQLGEKHIHACAKKLFYFFPTCLKRTQCQLQISHLKFRNYEQQAIST